jgi:hypothetical protein
MCTILNTKATKADLQLIWQLIAAMANQANFGAGCDAIADANAYISDLKTFAGKAQCGTNDPDRNLELSIASELDICNNSGEGFCEDDDTSAAFTSSPEDGELSNDSASATGGCSLLTKRPTGLEYEKLAMWVILGLLPWAISRRRRVKVLQ